MSRRRPGNGDGAAAVARERRPRHGRCARRRDRVRAGRRAHAAAPSHGMHARAARRRGRRRRLTPTTIAPTSKVASQSIRVHCRHARASDDHGLGAGAHAQPAHRDRAPARGFRVQGAVAAALERHRRAAGRRAEDAHAADRQRLAEAAAHRARSLGRARQADRARDVRCRDRARPSGARPHQGSADPHGAELRRSRHRAAGAARGCRTSRSGARSGFPPLTRAATSSSRCRTTGAASTPIESGPRPSRSVSPPRPRSPS